MESRDLSPGSDVTSPDPMFKFGGHGVDNVTVTSHRDATPLGPLWLSHHYACDADRCVAVGEVHVCRRCAAMFAGFFPALFLLSFGGYVAQAGDYGLVLAMVAFAGYEFVQVVRGRMGYSARRVLVVSPFVGVVLAWLGASGFRDGLGPAHIGLGLTALAMLVVLVVNGTVVRGPVEPR